jgi:DNA-binding transcriptional MocR family regulator
MTLWCPDLSGRTGPLFRRIADAIGADVASGRLAKGTRLPPQRDLAFALGVSLNTVSRAYTDATERGFVAGEVGRGTYVRTPAVPPPQEDTAALSRPDDGPIDFSRNLPTPGPADAVLAEALADLSASGALFHVLDDQPPGGPAHHRDAGAHWLNRLGLDDARPDNIVLTVGAQQGILAAMLATLSPGDVLLTEALTFAPVKTMARHLGLRIHPVPSEGGTLDPDELAATCARVAAKAVYVLPTLHTPTTATMDAERRAAIATVARTHDLTIIEDDVFGALPPDRPPPLAAFAPERTLFVTSVSKSLAPGLRVGYVHGPSDRIPAVRTAVTLSCWMPPPLMAEIVARWILDGTADRLNAAQRSEAFARQALARDLIPNAHLRADPHGFHAWIVLAPPWTADAFRLTADARGVAVVAGGVFSVEPSPAPRAIRLCLSHERTRERVQAGLGVIADLLRTPSQPDSFVL